MRTRPGSRACCWRRFPRRCVPSTRRRRSWASRMRVTTFTMSDFSRTFQPNSNSGSDHGWGSHHIVLGGAVKGGKLYGSVSHACSRGPDDFDMNGRWIPSTSTVQYAATLASWFGVSAAQLNTIFPSLGAFGSANILFCLGWSFASCLAVPSPVVFKFCCSCPCFSVSQIWDPHQIVPETTPTFGRFRSSSKTSSVVFHGAGLN